MRAIMSSASSFDTRGGASLLALALGLLAAHLLHAAQFGLALLAVVAAAFVGVAQDVVGAAGLREAHGGIWVVMVLVGMHGLRQRAPGCLDFLLPGVSLHAEHRIGVTHNFHPLPFCRP
jgi:hypothetical protein